MSSQVGDEAKIFSFDGLMVDMEEAILSAQKTVFLINRLDTDKYVAELKEKDSDRYAEIRRFAARTLRRLRRAYQRLDVPMTWFKMEKGYMFRKTAKGKWVRVKEEEHV